MKKSRVWSSVIDGLVCAVVLQILMEYTCSSYLFTPERDFERDAVRLSILCVFGAVLSAVVFWRLICQERDSGRLWLRFAVSAGSAVVSYCAITLVLKLVLRISLLPLRTLGNGDGLLLLLFGALFTAASFALRLLTVLTQLLVNRHRKKRVE